MSEGRLSVLLHLSALLTEAMFVTPVASVKLQYFSNYLPSTEENNFISQDDVTDDKLIIRAISYITNADIIIMGERAPSLRQLDAVRQ